jgi:hypothetical protein
MGARILIRFSALTTNSPNFLDEIYCALLLKAQEQLCDGWRQGVISST